jgi:hypothetical protein
MNPKIILCLALVLSGGLFGCSTTNNSSGLTCEISVPALKPDSNRMLQAGLILKNNSSQPIRVCTFCAPFRDRWQADLGFDVILNPDTWFSDAPTLQQLADSIKALQPNESIELPFDIWTDTNSTMRIMAHYEVGKTNHYYGVKFEKLDMWRGTIDAKPFTIKIEP